MRNTQYFILLGLLLLLISCNNKSEKKTSSNLENIIKFEILPSESNINWTGYKTEKGMLLNHYGTVRITKGEIEKKENKIVGGEVILDMNSITIDDELDSAKNVELLFKLMNIEFLDTQKYPIAKIKIESVKNIEEISDFNSRIEAILTLKNVSKKISFQANVKEEKGQIFIKTEKITLNRQHYNISYYEVSKEREVMDDFDLQMSIIGKKK